MSIHTYAYVAWYELLEKQNKTMVFLLKDYREW